MECKTPVFEALCKQGLVARRVDAHDIEIEWRLNGDWMETEWRLSGDWVEIEWRWSRDWAETKHRLSRDWAETKRRLSKDGDENEWKEVERRLRVASKSGDSELQVGAEIVRYEHETKLRAPSNGQASCHKELECKEIESGQIEMGWD